MVDGAPERLVNGAEQPEWLRAAGELARQLSCDTSLQLGASVESCGDMLGLLELAYSCTHGFHPDRRVVVWDEAFGVLVAAWSGEIAADVVSGVIENLWSDIRRGRDGLDQESDLARFASRCFLYGFAASGLGGAQAGLARHLADRRGSDEATERRADGGSVGVPPADTR